MRPLTMRTKKTTDCQHQVNNPINMKNGNCANQVNLAELKTLVLDKCKIPISVSAMDTFDFLLNPLFWMSCWIPTNENSLINRGQNFKVFSDSVRFLTLIGLNYSSRFIKREDQKHWSRYPFSWISLIIRSILHIRSHRSLTTGWEIMKGSLSIKSFRWWEQV